MTEEEIVARIEKANRHCISGEFAQAETLAREVIAADSLNAVAIGILGRCAAGMGKNEQALIFFNQALQQSENRVIRAKLWLRIAMIQNQLGQYDAAIATAGRTIDEAEIGRDMETKALGINQVGAIHVLQGKYFSALEYFFKHYQFLRRSVRKIPILLWPILPILMEPSEITREPLNLTVGLFQPLKS